MKVITKSYICGVTCFFGDKNCNNYCNHNHSIPMPDRPATYQVLEMEEVDMWKDVIEILAAYIPEEKTIFQVLMDKYSIKQNQ